MMYRIIGGLVKGRRVSAPKNFEVRPTTDFAKEALFSILSHRYHFPTLSVLDLFAGIGSITLEFASRGCLQITSVEHHYKQLQFIEQKAEEFQLNTSIQFIKNDVFSFLNSNTQSFDIIFADPPFDLEDHQYQNLIEKSLPFLTTSGVLIIEHATKNTYIPDHFEGCETRKYGNVSFSLFFN